MLICITIRYIQIVKMQTARVGRYNRMTSKPFDFDSQPSVHTLTMHRKIILQDCRGTTAGSDLISAEVDLFSPPTTTFSILNISMPMLSDTDSTTWSCNTGTHCCCIHTDNASHNLTCQAKPMTDWRRASVGLTREYVSVYQLNAKDWVH